MCEKIGYCPLCDEEFVFHSESYIAHCPKCGHHLSLHDAENNKEKETV